MEKLNAFIKIFCRNELAVGLTTPRVRAYRSQQTKALESQKEWRPWKNSRKDKTLNDKYSG